MPFEITSKRPGESDYRSLQEAHLEIFLNLRPEGAFVGLGVSEGADEPRKWGLLALQCCLPHQSEKSGSLRMRRGADVCPSRWGERQGHVAETHTRCWFRRGSLERAAWRWAALAVRRLSCWEGLRWLLSLSSSGLFSSIWGCSLPSEWVQCAPKLFMETDDIFSGK